jgi:hypothetical protein
MEAERTSETPFSFNETLRRYHLRITTSNPNVWRHVTMRTARMAIHMAQVVRDHSETVTSPSPVFECDAIWMRVFATARNEGAPSVLVTGLATCTHPNLVVCVSHLVPCPGHRHYHTSSAGSALCRVVCIQGINTLRLRGLGWDQTG